MPFEPHDGRAVSPVIGTVLLVAVTVVLAVTIGTLATTFESEFVEPRHPVAFETEWVADGADNDGNGAYVVLALSGGNAVAQERVVVRDEYGNEVTWADVWTTSPKPVVEPGDYVHLDGHGSDSDLRAICDRGDTYRIVIESGDGSTTVVDRFVAPSPPTDPSTDC
jgi:flagellin-like protein